VVPESIAGWPESFGYDRVAKRFELKFTGDPAITAPSQIFVPAAADFAATFDVSCDGVTLTPARDAASGLVSVPCNGSGAHAIVVIGH
jgi:hypothetical protein